MIKSVALGVTEGNWDTVIRAAAETRGVDALAAPLSLIAGSAEFRDQAQRAGLAVRHAFQSVAGDSERYVFESEPSVRQRLVGEWTRRLARAASFGLQTVSVDAGLDRFPPAKAEGALAMRIAVLRHIASCLDGSVAIAVRVRYPLEFPHSHAWERAARLAHDVMDPRCRVQMDVFPEEAGDWPSWADFSRTFYLHAKVLAIHWDGLSGRDLQELGVPERLENLINRGFRGTPVFMPSPPANDIRGLRRICASLGQNFSQPTV